MTRREKDPGRSICDQRPHPCKATASAVGRRLTSSQDLTGGITWLATPCTKNTGNASPARASLSNGNAARSRSRAAMTLSSRRFRIANSAIAWRGDTMASVIKAGSS